MGETSQRTRLPRTDAAKQSAPSPLDPYLRQVLTWAEAESRGFSQTAFATEAESLGWQPAFADAVFTSARVRGLIGPFFGKGARGRSLWQLSARGRAWLEANEFVGESISNPTDEIGADAPAPQSDR